jgi:FAD/FMN-containing dehydrogenase
MIPEIPVRELKTRLSGQLLGPADDGYDAARSVFNAMIDRRPALIARCGNADDVVHAVNFARERDLLMSVKCTGHNVAGFAVCDEGMVIDLSPMKGISVDPVGRTVRVEAGCTWGEVNDALQPHALAAAGGFVSITGVSGLTLGGGLGWLVRKHGLALDNLISARVVLADGQVVTASAAENDDLFWGLRGGGGNFGIVTDFEFKVYPAGVVLAGIVLHPFAAAREALRHWREVETSTPEEFSGSALLFHFPQDPSAPEPLRGASLVGLGGVYAGAGPAAEKAVESLRAYGPPMADMFQPTPYNEVQRMADFAFPPGLHNYWKSSYLKGLSDDAIDVLVDHYSRVPSPHTVIVLEHNGDGALERVPESATAFGHRDWPYNFVVTSAWSDPADTERNIAWTRGLYEAMRPFLATAAYVNYYTGDEGPEGLSAAYGEAKLARLAALKTKYDPDNLFRMNQNVPPAASGQRAAGAGA